MTTPTRSNTLAQRLKAARGSMQGKELADRLGWRAPKVSKIEHGHQLPSVADLTSWAEGTGAGPTALAQWTAMLEQILADRHRHEDELTRGMAGMQRRFHEKVKAAAFFGFYEKMFFPLFTQTPGYTAATFDYVVRVLRHQDPHDPENQADLAAATTLRQASVALVYDPARTFELIIDEAVLYTWRYSIDIMRAQLVQLKNLTGLPNVRIGIYPMRRLVQIWNVNSFEIYGDWVSVETAIGEEQKTAELDVNDYRTYLSQLWLDSLEGDAAAQTIQAAIDALPSGT